MEEALPALTLDSDWVENPLCNFPKPDDGHKYSIINLYRTELMLHEAGVLLEYLIASPTVTELSFHSCHVSEANVAYLYIHLHRTNVRKLYDEDYFTISMLENLMKIPGFTILRPVVLKNGYHQRKLYEIIWTRKGFFTLSDVNWMRVATTRCDELLAFQKVLVIFCDWQGLPKEMFRELKLFLLNTNPV